MLQDFLFKSQYIERPRMYIERSRYLGNFRYLC